jgi:hypothetical protein
MPVEQIAITECTEPPLAPRYDESLIGFCCESCTIFACTAGNCSHGLENCNR